jgi:hypothetical protein
MIDLGTVTTLVLMGFVFGTVSYELLRRPQKDKLRLTGIALFGVIIGETLVADGMIAGPLVLGFHPVVAMIAAFSSVYLDVAWKERKILPWDIIGDLKQISQPFKAIANLKVSVQDEPDNQKSKAA